MNRTPPATGTTHEMRRRLLWALGAGGLGLVGCAPLQMAPERRPLPPEVQRSSVRFQKEYLLTAGDTVEVSVWRVPEASRVVVIRPDGHISLPLLQDVKAAGLTPRELAEEVRKGLAGRLLNPEVAVIPQQVRQATVYVLGDVRQPGGVPLRTAVTAAQALAAAGGPLRSGQERDATLIRLADDGHLEAIPLSGDGWSQPAAYLQLATLTLRADDIIFVPEGGRSQVMRLLSDFLVPLQIYLNYRLITEAL